MAALDSTKLKQLEKDKTKADVSQSRSDRAAYYSELLQCGFNYGALAEGVVLDNTISGVIANGFLALRSSGYRTIQTDGNLSAAIQTNLMDGDFAARSAAIGTDLSYEAVRNYHAFGFAQARPDIGITCWTAYDPCEILGSGVWTPLVNGGLFAAAGTYLSMVDYGSDPVSVWRYFNGTALQALRWVLDIDTVTINRVSALSRAQSASIDPHIHFGGITDGSSIQLASGDTGVAGLGGAKIVSSGGAFIDLSGGADNVVETKGGDVIYVGNTYAGASSGNEFIHLTSKDPQADTTVIFGKGGGHSVLKSDVVNKDNRTDAFRLEHPSSNDSDPSPWVYKGLDHLHIVFDGLGRSDLTFYYKQAALVVDTATSVIGGGEDFFGNGERALFLRGGNGALHAWAFDGSGNLNAGLDLVGAQGTSVTVDTGTKVVGGGGTFFGNGEHVAFVHASDGGLGAWGIDAYGTVTIQEAFTLDGAAPLKTDTATTVMGDAGDYFHTGRHAVFIHDAGGTQHVWEFNGSGVRTAVQ